MAGNELNTISKALKNGDRHVFEKLYADYYEKLCVYLLSYVQDRDKVEDIVQDTFMSIWAKHDQIHITSSFKSYLYKAAHNRLVDLYRKKEKTDGVLSSYYHTALLRAVNLNEEHKQKRLRKLDKCISQLPERCRNVFVANKIDGLRYKQVASKFNISLKTVEGHVTRAYKLIKSCMLGKKQQQETPTFSKKTDNKVDGLK